MVKKYLPIIGLVLGVGAVSFAGYKVYKRSQLKGVFEASCSNHIIQWASTESLTNSMTGGLLSGIDGDKNIIKQFSFGPSEEKMKRELAQYKREYIDSGKDKLKDIQIDWAESYVPGYMKSCVGFYMNYYGACDKMSDKEERSNCATNLDQKYQEMIQASLLESKLLEKKPWDLNKATLEKMERTHRRYLAGELVESMFSNVFQSGQPAKENQKQPEQ